MVSSISSFSGLSAADIQSLFGAIGANTSSSDSSSSTNSAAASAAQSASSPVAKASPSDPVKAIKSILAQAQSRGGPAANIGSITTAEAAYAAQASESNSQIWVSAAQKQPPLAFAAAAVVEAAYSSATATSNSNDNANIVNQGMSSEQTTYSETQTSAGPSTSQWYDRIDYAGVSVIRADAMTVRPLPTQTSKETSEPGANYVQLSASVVDQSAGHLSAIKVDLGFTLEGLGNVTVSDGVFQAHAVDAQHAYAVNFQLNIFSSGPQSGGLVFNMDGLTETQAHAVSRIIEKAASAANIQPYSGPNYALDSVDYMLGVIKAYEAPTAPGSGAKGVKEA